MYKLLRNILFLFGPEWVHDFSMNSLKILCRIPGIKSLVTKAFSFKNIVNITTGAQEPSLFNIQFANKIGLGAGFDKNAIYLNELEALGFGFVEIGTVTPVAQNGNKKPRLFRLPRDKALINRMGFNNDGVEMIAERLKSWQLAVSCRCQASKRQTANGKLIVGGNIGKNKLTPNENAWKDYETCFIALHEWVDYFVVNVSSPNTPGLRELQERESLKKILTNLQFHNSKHTTQKPILLKIAPDLTLGQINDIIALALEIKLDGLVVSNTTISRERLQTGSGKLQSIGTGGLSGLPLKQKSTDLVKYIHQQTDARIPIIASGGIFTGEDAKEKLDAGASLVQVWTGFIYEGPGIVKRICKHLEITSLQSAVSCTTKTFG